MMSEEGPCPNCGSDVLSWEIICPGCEQIPWNTRKGKEALRKRRMQDFFSKNGFVLVIITLMLFASYAWLPSLFNEERKIINHLVNMHQYALMLEERLHREPQGSPAYERTVQEAEGWLDHELPMALDILRDHSKDERIRLGAMTVLVSFFGPQGTLGSTVPRQRAQAIEALQAMERRTGNDPDADNLREAAGLVLDHIDTY